MRRLANFLLILSATVLVNGCDSGTETSPSEVTEPAAAESPAAPSNSSTPAQQGSGTTN